MTKEISGGPNDSQVMLLMLQNQQLAERETQNQRDAAHEIGVTFLKVGNIYRGLEQSQKKFEDTIQWVNAGMTAVSYGQSIAAVSSASKQQAPKVETPKAEASKEKKDLSPPAGEPTKYDYAKEAYKLGETWGKSSMEQDDKDDKMNEDLAKSASKELISASERFDKGAEADRQLTKKIIEVAQAGKKKEVAG